MKDEVRVWSEAEIDALVAAFEDHSLPPEQWTHEAHLTVATVYTIADAKGALDKIRAGIQGFNISKGVPQTDTGGYHETLTVAYMRLVRGVLNSAGQELGLPERVALVIAALVDRKVMLDYYSRDLIMSREARYGWVQPDLKLLP